MDNPNPCRAYLAALHSDARPTLPDYAPMSRPPSPGLLSRWEAVAGLLVVCLAVWGGAVLAYGLAVVVQIGLGQ